MEDKEITLKEALTMLLEDMKAMNREFELKLAAMEETVDSIDEQV